MQISTPERKFWTWFEGAQDMFLKEDEKHRDESYLLLSERLSEVNQDLTFAISSADDKGSRELIISADGLTHAFPAVIKLVDQAPSFRLWDVRAFRPRIRVEGFQVDLGDRMLKADDMLFEFEVIDSRIQLHLFIKDFDPEAPYLYSSCQIMLDSVLGEYDAATKIQYLSLQGQEETEHPDRLPQLDLLPMLIDDLNKGRLEGSIPLFPDGDMALDSYEIEENFALMRGMLDDFPNYVLINPDFYQFSKKREFPWLLTLIFKFEAVEETGLPTEEMQEKLNQLEQEITRFINRFTKAYYVYRMTWKGERRVNFHLADWQAVEENVISWIASSKEEIGLSIAYERDWESMRSMLGLLFDASED